MQQNSNQVVEELPGEERGMPSVNTVRPSTAKRGFVIMILLFIVCTAAGVGYWKYKINAARTKETTAQKDLQVSSAVPTRTFIDQPETETPTGNEISVVPLPSANNGSVPTLPENNTTVENTNPPPTLDKSGSSLMANNTGSNASDSSQNSQKLYGTNGGESGRQNNEMSEMLTATRTPPRKASMIGDRNFILAKGSFIDCALQTRLDSTIPGMTACVITRDIYSDNGKVLLLERGSTVSGEYKSNMTQGMARIFVLWNRIKTQNGVIVNLDSPGTDQLGGAGVPGYIDTHFWQRFGGALMLSLIDDVARGVTSSASSNGNNQFNFNSTSDATQNMATEALKNTINIPPTLYKNQGEQVGIYIARDLDFSEVYDVSSE